MSAILVYIIVAMVIVYHLHTYTINKKLARHAIWFFIVITVILIVAQVVAFMFIPFDLFDLVIMEESTSSFGQPF